MKTTGKIRILLVGMALSVSGINAALAQPGYGQPEYNQPGYNQPNYNNQPGYNQPGYGQPPGQDFYDELGPYGQWVRTPEYGNVWIPDAEPGFQPYATNGHWVVTEYGNTWVSDYAWGWAPFHYGRWYQDRYRGWAWVPGNDWGPAWVSWRSGGGYYGWAPLGPIRVGSSFNNNVNVNIPYNYWTFVPQIYITSPRLYSYCVSRPRVVNIYQNTTIINNVYRANNRAYAHGPRREEIEYVTRQRVPVYRIENAGRPGRTIVQDNSIGFYRPDMNRGGRNDGYGYTNDHPDYPRRDYSPNRGYNESSRTNPGTYNGNPRSSQPAETNQRYPQPGQSFPGNESHNSRYERESRAGQSVPQPVQTDPQQSRQEPSLPAGQWGRGRRRESTVQPESAPPVVSQPQAQQPVEDDQRGQGQQVPQSSYPERRGGSRGPR